MPRRAIAARQRPRRVGEGGIGCPAPSRNRRRGASTMLHRPTSSLRSASAARRNARSLRPRRSRRCAGSRSSALAPALADEEAGGEQVAGAGRVDDAAPTGAVGDSTTCRRFSTAIAPSRAAVTTSVRHLVVDSAAIAVVAVAAAGQVPRSHPRWRRACRPRPPRSSPSTPSRRWPMQSDVGQGEGDLAARRVRDLRSPRASPRAGRSGPHR